MAERQQHREQNGHEGIDMLDRIKRQPPELIRRRVAIPVGDISMRIFVRHHRE